MIHRLIAGIVITIIILITFYSCFAIKKEPAQIDIADCKECVMNKGMKICAINGSNSICIAATSAHGRRITWDGKSRNVNLIPRKERWYGKLGLYYPGDGNHWKNHNGVTRGIINEAQLHFSNRKELTDFIYKYHDKQLAIFNDKGIYISWYTSVREGKKEGGYLSLSIYQILIDGKIPNYIPGSQNDMIVVEAKTN